MIKLKVLVSLK